MKIALVLAIIILTIAWSLYTGGVPKKYRLRKCTGRNWKREFPNASKKDIRKFLFIFTDAFAFLNEHKLKFEPNDKILDIYKTLYPSEWIPDSLELETLAEDIEREYDINFSNIWHENLTLGDLFLKVNNV